MRGIKLKTVPSIPLYTAATLAPTITFSSVVSFISLILSIWSEKERAECAKNLEGVNEGVCEWLGGGGIDKMKRHGEETMGDKQCWHCRQGELWTPG